MARSISSTLGWEKAVTFTSSLVNNALSVAKVEITDTAVFCFLAMNSVKAKTRAGVGYLYDRRRLVAKRTNIRST